MIKIITRIESLISERKTLINNLAELFTTGILERKRDGKLTEDSIDTLYNSLNELSDKEKVDVLLKSVKILATKQPEKKTKSQDNKRPKSRYFN